MQKLGKNHDSYLGETIDIRAVLCELESAARQQGWSTEIFHQTLDFKWLALRRAPSRITQPPSLRSGATGHASPRRSEAETGSRVYISAGIHGDEPAGPLAALRLLRENQWPGDTEIVLLPCLNPTGFEQNKRENGQGIDLNRDYLHLQSAEVRAHITWLERQAGFDFCLCLHEDWESHGFYLFELNPEHRPSLAEAMLAAVSRVCPVDPSEIIEGWPARHGIIQPSADPRSRPQWPEAFWLLTRKTRLTYTLEAPSDFPLNTRVDALVAGVNAALEKFRCAPAA